MTSVYTIGRNTNITMTRGDSFYATVTMRQDGEPYTPAEGDVVFFAMENHAGVTVIAKTIPTDSLLLALYPEETKGLPIGTYTYNIRLVAAAGTVDTFVRGKIKLEKEVE